MIIRRNKNGQDGKTVSGVDFAQFDIHDWKLYKRKFSLDW